MKLMPRLALMFLFLLGLAVIAHQQLRLEAADLIISDQVLSAPALADWHHAGAATRVFLEIFASGGAVVVLVVWLRVLRRAAEHSASSLETLTPLTDALRELKQQETEQRRQTHHAMAEVTGMRAIQTTVLEGISSGVLTVDPRGRIATCNRSARHILGWRDGPPEGRTLAELFQGNPPDLLLSPVRGDQQPQRVECEWVPRQGSPRTLGMSLSGIDTPQGPLTAVLFSDLTEVRRLRQQMELRRHLAHLGEVSAGIAHEFRNNMGAVMGYARLLGHEVSPDGPAHEVVQAMMSELSQMDQLIRDLLDFSRPQRMELAPVNPAALVRNAAEVGGSGLGVRVQVTAAESLPPLLADDTHLRQSLINLVRNACEAALEGGNATPLVSVTVTVDPRERGRTRPRALLLSVTDNGPGIAEESRGKIFLPFFTTKQSGTGMGLAQVHKVVIAHGGEVHADNVSGNTSGNTSGGACFQMRLPTIYAEQARQEHDVEAA